MKYYLEDVREVFKRTESSENGLSQSEAERRLEKYGKNKLAQAKQKSLVRRFFEQLADPMIIILIVAAVISAVHGHTRRLVECEQVGVFIQNVQRHGHGCELAAGALIIDAHGEHIPRGHAVNGAGVRAVETDAVRHGLDAGDRTVGHMQLTPEQAPDRAACLLRRDGERQPAHSCAASAAAYAA